MRIDLLRRWAGFRCGFASMRSRGAVRMWSALSTAVAAGLLQPLPVDAAPAREPARFETVPFHGALIDGKPAGLEFDAARGRFRISQAKRAWELPADFVPQAIVSADAVNLLAIGRRALHSELQIYRLAVAGRDVQRVFIEPDIARRLVFMHAFATRAALIAIVYDTEETVASGRSGSVVRDGVDLYTLEIRSGKAQFSRLVDKAPIAGLDNAFRDIAVGDDHFVCAQSGCIQLAQGKSDRTLTASVLRPPQWNGYAQVELFVRDGQARAILRRDEDDRLAPSGAAGVANYRDCPITGGDACIDLPGDRLPSGVDARGRIAYASSCDEVTAILKKDLSRLPAMGLPFWAVNNYEGRIAWGQIYVLDGLLDLASGLALPGPRFNDVRNLARRRVELEVAYWSRLAATAEPWFWSRRYSLERANLLSVLHLGRMARVAQRSLAVADNPATRALLSSLRDEMQGFTHSLEEPQGPSLFLRKGMPFWLDGSNAPWNYQSGWIEGIAALDRVGLASAESRAAAIAMLRQFVATEIEPRRPDLWNYCSGRCQDGWTATDAVSSNTPVWEGNKTRTATAHISYRTMDARALLDAAALWKLDDLGWSASYVRDLVERGRLYPSAAAPLAQFGVRPGLGTDLQLRYGRSTMPYETHSQVWALDAVGRTFAACVQ